MSIIDLLRSPLAIAGIVGSVAIGGGLTAYVVRDGSLPGQADAFPSVFLVETLFPPGGGRCELDADVASGCTFSLEGNAFGRSYITFRRHDRDASRVVVSGQQYGKRINPTSYGRDIIEVGIVFGTEGVLVKYLEGSKANGR
ncbi:MAG: hypothetical protein HQL43_04235 [Alphaproteobacteria bacterium]|nr:hypothetical protein [Alphaproteobacteria bacterium]